MKRVFITGAAGFVGRHLARHFEESGWDVDATDILYGTEVRSLVDYVTDKYDLVIHAAAADPHRAAIDTKIGNFPYNVSLDSMMLEWAIRTGQPRFVYLSSSAVYPKELQTIEYGRAALPEYQVTLRNPREPDGPYGWTKLFGEIEAKQAREAGVRVHVVRPFSGYGTDQTADFPFRAFIDRALAKEEPFKIWGSADQVRDFIHIDDICAGIAAIVEADYDEPTNLCTGRGTTMRALAHMVTDAAGYTPGLLIDRTAPMGVHYRVGHPERFFHIYTPKISLEEGVRRAIRGI